MDVVTLARLLGHANPSITLDKYGHALSDHQRSSVEKLDGLYQPGPFSAPRVQPEQGQTPGPLNTQLGRPGKATASAHQTTIENMHQISIAKNYLRTFSIEKPLISEKSVVLGCSGRDQTCSRPVMRRRKTGFLISYGLRSPKN